MPGAYFYLASLSHVAEEFLLDEAASRHIVQVLRMQDGEHLILTDGRGLRAKASILDAHKKRCRVRLSERKFQKSDANRVTIALSLLKNTNRFEWFLEKATELGISEVIPLKCSRTEKQQFRMDRMQSIMESALIQSQQSWMPVLQEPAHFLEFVENAVSDQKFIAHCGSGEKRQLSGMIDISLSSQLILVGPEGDFTDEEINMAFRAGFVAVHLGDHRLRSETAAVAAASLLKLI
ncbi:MAG: RsmE family RNA methyltransferase [Bacteroidota bacterium]|nr:RsmE family RNA methyltransferase [Bacteroidota bacterium]MDP4211184.1 RsmE family RNA methyltransferase [Bacteroidota bacterium]MDP4249418.1 RsmE family RNA methyltransferase [Bacteroidota bacterium]